VHIEIPLDVIVAEIGDQPATAWALPTRPGPSLEAAARAAALLRSAKRPLIVAGGGASGAAGEVKALAERLDAPVFMTINGKGILPPAHPLALAGNLGMAPLREALANSDVVLAIGTEFGETEMYPEPHPIVINGGLIRIDIDPLQLTTGVAAALPIAADARLACEAILKELNPAGAREGAKRAKAIRAAVEAGLWRECRTHRKLVDAITAALPNAIIAGDQTEPVYAANQFYEAPQPRSYFNSSTGYGTLGYGLPAAFGAKLGAPSRPAVCLIGDGGLQFSLSEMAAAVEAKIPVAIVVWNNSSYGEIKNFMLERKIPTIGVDIHTPDLAGLAHAMGCAAAVPKTLGELDAALKDSAKRGVPTLVEIKADSALAKALAA